MKISDRGIKFLCIVFWFIILLVISVTITYIHTNVLTSIPKILIFTLDFLNGVVVTTLMYYYTEKIIAKRNGRELNFSKHVYRLFEGIKYYVIDYRSKDMYLCRFRLKTGSVIVTFVQSQEEAKEYMNWYLGKVDAEKHIYITPTKVNRILPGDIEEFGFERVSFLQRKIINPIAAFLTQPSIAYVSFKSLIIFSLLTIFGIGSYFYLSGKYVFVGAGSFTTASNILIASTSFLSFILVTGVTGTIITGAFSIKNAINNYYTKNYEYRKSIAEQLIVFALVPMCYSIFFKPVIEVLVELAQNQGYFLL